MVKISEDIRMVARESAERIVRSGKRRSEFGSLSVRTEEAQIEDWTTGILGEMVFQKVLAGPGDRSWSSELVGDAEGGRRVGL